MQHGVIYCILNIKNNKKYIGSTINPLARRKSHEMRLQHGQHSKKFQADWEGSSFEWYIIEAGIIKPRLFVREQFWIDFFDASNTGYNVLAIAGAQPTFSTKGMKISKKKKKTADIHLEGSARNWWYRPGDPEKKKNTQKYIHTLPK